MAAASSSGQYWWETEHEEIPRGAAQGPAAVRDGDGDVSGPNWESSDDEMEMSQETAGAALVEYLVSLKHKGVLSAKQVCVIDHLGFNSRGARGSRQAGPASILSVRLCFPTHLLVRRWIWCTPKVSRCQPCTRRPRAVSPRLAASLRDPKRSKQTT